MQVSGGAPEALGGTPNSATGGAPTEMLCTWYIDNDRDGFGFSYPVSDEYHPIEAPCDVKPWFTRDDTKIDLYVLNNTDCVDFNEAVHPGETLYFDTSDIVCGEDPTSTEIPKPVVCTRDYDCDGALTCKPQQPEFCR